MYLAEAAGRCLSPTEARSPEHPRSPDFAAGQQAGSGGLHSSQVMGLEGLMYGSPTYIRPPRCGVLIHMIEQCAGMCMLRAPPSRKGLLTLSKRWVSCAL